MKTYNDVGVTKSSVTFARECRNRCIVRVRLINSKAEASSKAENNGDSDIKKESGDENGTPTCDSGLCVLSGERKPPQTVHGVFVKHLTFLSFFRWHFLLNFLFYERL